MRCATVLVWPVLLLGVVIFLLADGGHDGWKHRNLLLGLIGPLLWIAAYTVGWSGGWIIKVFLDWAHRGPGI